MNVGGWVCPVCGAGNALWVGRCACVPVPQTPVVTTTGTTSLPRFCCCSQQFSTTAGGLCTYCGYPRMVTQF